MHSELLFFEMQHKLDRSIDFIFFVSFSTVARCQVDAEDHSSIVDDVVGEHSDSGAEEDDQDLDNINLTSAPGVETVSVFPKNSAKGYQSFLLLSIVNCNDFVKVFFLILSLQWFQLEKRLSSLLLSRTMVPHPLLCVSVSLLTKTIF